MRSGLWVFLGLCLWLLPAGVGRPEGQACAQDAGRTEYLMVGYTSKGRVPGVAVYRNENGTLRGRWTNGQAQGRILTETAVPQS